MARRIKKAKIEFISLVPRGANQFPVIYKSDSDTFDAQLLVKDITGSDFMDRGEIIAVVYAPEIRDSQGDIASAEVIKDMMYDAMKRGFNVDLKHNCRALAKSDAYIAETFIIQKNDSRFADMKDYSGKAVDVTGGWGIVIKVDNPTLRAQYRDGAWNGVSMFGSAEVLQEKSDRTNPSKGAINVEKSELSEILKSNNTELGKSIVAGIGEVLKALIPGSGETTTQSVTKTGEGDKPKFVPPAYKAGTDIRVHRLNVRKAKHTFDLNNLDPDDSDGEVTLLGKIDEVDAEIAKLSKKGPEGEGEGGTGESSEVKAAKAELAAANAKLEQVMKGSNQGGGGQEQNPTATKATADAKPDVLIKAGVSAADRMNQRRGYAAAGK